MPVPPISQLPVAPQVSDTPSVFSQRANTFVAALSTLVTETNATVEEINAAVAGNLVQFDGYKGSWEAGTFDAGDLVFYAPTQSFFISLEDGNDAEPPGGDWQQIGDALSTSYDNTASGLDATNVQAAVDETNAKVDAIQAKLVGEVFYLWDHLSGVDAPDNSGDIKFIRLTANDAYNNGLLQNQSVSGSEPLVEATAQIATGPLQGQTVHLINTEQAFLRARESSGALQMDQMQRIVGRIDGENIGNRGNGFEKDFGALNLDGGQNGTEDGVGGSASTGPNRNSTINLNSADSPNARVSDTTSGETRSKNVSATAYMRIA